MMSLNSQLLEDNLLRFTKKDLRVLREWQLVSSWIQLTIFLTILIRSGILSKRAELGLILDRFFITIMK